MPNHLSTTWMRYKIVWKIYFEWISRAQLHQQYPWRWSYTEPKCVTEKTFIIIIIIIIIKVTKKMQLYRLIYLSLLALHVSGDDFAHHQEHLTVFIVSGNIHPSCCRLVSWVSWNCKAEFVVEKVALKHVFLWVLQFFLVSIIPL